MKIIIFDPFMMHRLKDLFPYELKIMGDRIGFEFPLSDAFMQIFKAYKDAEKEALITH